MEFSNPDWGSVAMTTEDLRRQAEGPSEDTQKELAVEDFMRRKWEREQMKMKKQLFVEDADEWSRYRITHENEAQHPFKKRLQYIGGVDISFVKGDNINACAAFVVLNFPELEVVHEDMSMVKLTAPYIPGFLAFREADFLVEKIKKLKETKPEIMPQVVLVDGNGILHPRGFGLACQLGVLTDLAMIGVAKNLLCVDGIERTEELKNKIKNLKKGGDSFPLIGVSGQQHGVVYRSHDSATNPVYISPGHKMSVDTAVWVTEQCIKFRVPEPTRQADLRSREYLRENWETEETKQQSKKTKQKRRPNPAAQNRQDLPKNDLRHDQESTVQHRPHHSSSEDEELSDFDFGLFD